MSHEIEADYVAEASNEDKYCPLCDSCRQEEGKNYCAELEQEVSATGTCDFFRSAD